MEEEIVLEEMIGIIKLMVKDKNMVQVFLIMKVFREKTQENNHNAPKLIEKYNI